MTILVIGSTGQLARHLRERWSTARFWGRAEADLADSSSLADKVAAAKPDAIVNAAAFTAVDKAESERDLAWRINAEAPAALARAAAKLDVALVQVSTDYVFDGLKQAPYLESDPVAPLNVYGRSKLGGELAVATLCPKHWILRTSWVFSEHGQNFVKTMLRLARDQDHLNVVDDQFGRPTYAGDLADLIDALLRAPEGQVPFGVHHVGGGAPTSWHGFADTILSRASAAGLIPARPSITGIPTAQYPTPARRPLRSVLQPSHSLHERVPDLMDWSRGLDRCLTKLRGKTA